MKLRTTLFIFFLTSLIFSQTSYDFIYIDQEMPVKGKQESFFNSISNVIAKSDSVFFYTSSSVDSASVRFDKNYIKNNFKDLIFDTDLKSSDRQIDDINKFFYGKGENKIFNSLKSSSNNRLAAPLRIHFFFSQDDFVNEAKVDRLIDRLLHVNKLIYNRNGQSVLNPDCEVFVYLTGPIYYDKYQNQQITVIEDKHQKYFAKNKIKIY